MTALDALTDEINSMTARHETGHASENVTAYQREQADRARCVAIHGEAAVAAAEKRELELYDRKSMTLAERAWLYRARKRKLVPQREPPLNDSDPSPFGGGTYGAMRKAWKRYHRREYLKRVCDKAQAGDAEAEITLREQIEIGHFNRLYDKFYAFANAWDRAPRSRRQTMLANTSILPIIHRIAREVAALSPATQKKNGPALVGAASSQVDGDA